LSLRSQPTDRITIDWSGSFDRSIFDQLNTASAASFADGDFVNFSGTDGTSTVDRSLISLRGEYEADIGTFITNTSYLRVVLDQNNDTDESPFDIFFGTVDTLETSIAQEFRFESEPIDLPLAGETSFVVGTNFSFNSVETDTALIGGSDLAFPGFPVTGGTSTILGDQDIFNFGVFGDARFKPTEKLELGVGLRFSRDVVSQVTEGEATGLFPLLGATPVLFDDEETFSAITPRGSVKYNWTDDFSTFVSIATGYRPGGFNTSGLAAALTPTFEEENAITFDGGFKSSWYDGRLIVNGSGFATIYNDIQVLSGVLTPTGIIAALDNAATARSIGAEIGVRAEPVDGLRLLIDYGLSKATFTDFIDSNGNDLTGTTLPNAPTHTLGFSIEYARSVFNDVAEGFIRWEHSFTSSFVTTLTVGGVSFDSRDIANLRAGLRGERFETEVFVENLFDEVYANGTSAGAGSLLLGIDPPLDVGPPRMIGARARIKF
ncbi:MAG: TonB-dependent receptor, partial [Pseudomonadota bacterium]